MVLVCVPAQRINMDVCTIPSYQVRPMSLLNLYGVEMGVSGLKKDPELTKEFRKEMSQFLPSEVLKATVFKEDFWIYLSDLMESYQQQLVQTLEGHQTEFKM